MINMIEGWEYKKLTDLADYINGYAFKPEDWSKDGLPIIRIEQLKNPEMIKDFFSGKLPKKNLIENGDLIFSWSASLFLSIWKNGKSALNQHLFKVIEKENINRVMLKYFIEFYLPEITKAAHGSTMQHITRKELERFGAMFPESINEQTKIAEILETIDATIEQTQSFINKQERIKTGLMQDLLTKGIDENGIIRSEETHEFKDSPLGRIPVEWDADVLGSRALVKGGKRLPAGHAYSEEDTGYRYLQTTDFINKRLIYSSLHNLSYITFKILQRYEIFEGDIFISIAGVNLGVAGVFRPDFNERTILTENAAKIKLLNDDLPEYISTQINGHLVQKQILEDKGIGAGVPKLALFRIQNLLLTWTEKEEQIRIVNCIHGINAFLDVQKDNLKKLELLKTAFMQDLLTGKKRVTSLLTDEVTNR